MFSQDQGRGSRAVGFPAHGSRSDEEPPYRPAAQDRQALDRKSQRRARVFRVPLTARCTEYGNFDGVPIRRDRRKRPVEIEGVEDGFLSQRAQCPAPFLGKQ